MKPHETYTNGDDREMSVGAEGDGDGDGDGDSQAEAEAWGAGDALETAGWAARALASLNALRKARQHYDVLLATEDGAELPAHRALLAALAPRLLPPGGVAGGVGAAAPAEVVRVPGVAGEALRALVEYAYTGRLAVGGGEPGGAERARALYRAAWRLRVEPARAHLAARLLRHLTPQDARPTRALPGLAPHQRAAIDNYIDHNLEAVLSCGGGVGGEGGGGGAGGAGGGGGAGERLVRVEMLLESSATRGEESALRVAAAALAWLRAKLRSHHQLDELCAEEHQLYVDDSGALRECTAGEGSAPLAAPVSAPGAAPASPTAPPASPAAEEEWAVIAARRVGGNVTRALLALGTDEATGETRLAGAQVSWRAGGAGARAGGGAVRPGAPLPRAPAPPCRAAASALRRGRCAHGAAALGDTLIVLGGYDRAEALRSVEAYEAGGEGSGGAVGVRWRPLPDLPGARARFPVAVLGRSIYALGGSDGQTELSSVVRLREHATGRWEPVAPLPAPRSQAGGAACDAARELYVVGGWAAGHPLRAVHAYSEDTGLWRPLPELGTARSQTAAVVWRGALWALGGTDPWKCIASTEYLTLPVEDTAGQDTPQGWQPGPPLPTARRSVGACAWRGAVVAAGGSDGAASLRRTELLLPPSRDDPGAGPARWAAGAELRSPRAAPSLAPLGDVLYAVGGYSGKEFLASVECLTDLAGPWTDLQDLTVPRALPAATTATATVKLQELSLEQKEDTKENGDHA